MSVLFCLSLKASEDEKDTEDPSSGAAKSKKRRKKKKKTEEEEASESQARRIKHKALRIMNETALFCLHIFILCTRCHLFHSRLQVQRLKSLPRCPPKSSRAPAYPPLLRVSWILLAFLHIELRTTRSLNTACRFVTFFFFQ